jgi:hypothetical protein
MTDQPAGPRCGNNPNAQLTPGDRKAVDDFKARLALQAAAKPHLDSAVWADGDPLMEVIAAAVWERCARDDADMPQLVRDDPRTIAAFAAAVVRAHAALSSAPADPLALLGAAELEEKPDLNVTRLTGDALNADEEVEPATPPAVLRVYIAGPYSTDPQACTAAAIAAGTAILDAGHAPLVPHLAHYWETLYGPRPYEDWMRIDLAWIEAADVVLRLPGRSPGADREVAVAVACGIPVVADVAGVVEYAGPAASAVVPSAPADRAGLRDRIAEAIAECAAIEADYRDQHDEVAVGARAAIIRIRARVAVLEQQPAVLPTPADRAAELETENARMRHELEVMYGGAFDSLKSAPVDRAAVLRELADQQEATATTDVIRKRRSIATARRLFAVELRRMADETQQPETEAPQPGDRVRVTYEATWAPDDDPRMVLASNSDGDRWHNIVPDSARIEIVPAVGAQQPKEA